MASTATTIRVQLTADALRPGDIILTADGDRWFAAFDVSTPAGPGDGGVRVWTATTDQARGISETLDFMPQTPLTVDRRERGPVTTHIA